MQSLVECVPNFSEGRRPEVIEAILTAVRTTPGVTLLDHSSDHDHNRTVVTFVGAPGAVEEAAFAAIRTAAELIDLTKHQGEHPRIGATDVVPFIPVRGVQMAECVEIARQLGRRVGEELRIPVYFYEQAATRPERQNLETIRKGEFEGLREAVKSDPDRAPDFGPSELGPAGATVIGARAPLVAYNVYLNTNDVEIANKIARAVRQSSGGLRFVKALGLLVDGRAQVSMNLTDFTRTPIHRAQELIRVEAARYGCQITHSELVGLVPEQAIIDSARWYLQLDLFSADQILERKLAEVSEFEAGPGAFIDVVASGEPTPGGGSVAALAGALAGALAAMVGRTTLGKKKYAEVEQIMLAAVQEAERLRAEMTRLIEEDSAAFESVMAAYRLPKDDSARPQAVQQAMTHAADVPLRTARLAVDVLRQVKVVATQGNVNAVTDAAVGAHMALAALEAATLNVLVNTRSIEKKAVADRLNTEIAHLREEGKALVDSILRTAHERMETPG